MLKLEADLRLIYYDILLILILTIYLFVKEMSSRRSRVSSTSVSVRISTEPSAAAKPMPSPCGLLFAYETGGAFKVDPPQLQCTGRVRPSTLPDHFFYILQKFQ